MHMRWSAGSFARAALAAAAVGLLGSPSNPPGVGIPVAVADAPLYPLNGGFVLLNMHGALFHDHARDFEENVAYAQWMRAGVIRVFATDSNTKKGWSGRRVGERIADIAPVFRAGNVKLLVALVNNHQPVPGEAAESFGWADGYQQLLLPFYTHRWRDAYLTFVRELIGTVRERNALDVIYAWEIGNELHTPQKPTAIIPFIVGVAEEIRRLDPKTPILPGTMGANHLQPWNPESPVARWLYCDAPVSAYTLHAYDWVSRERQGDMPIEWDLDYITSEPCPSGRQIPVIVEELGTSRELKGLYSGEQTDYRLILEIHQMRFVLGYPQVQGIGVWSGVSPRAVDRSYHDLRRGLTSYGPGALGGGSCYSESFAEPGARCRLEQAVRNLPTRP